VIYINKKRSQVGVMTTEELKKYLIENSTIDEKLDVGIGIFV